MKVYKHSEYDYVTIVEVPKSEVEKIDLCMCDQPKETLGNFYSRQDEKPDVLINAGFFATTTGASCFNIVDDGVVYSEHEKYKWGMGITSEHKTITYGTISNAGYQFVDFLSGYPNLVDGGKFCAPWTFATEINYYALRSMIGYNNDTIFFVTVNKPGMQFTDMANLMIDIGCLYAINLDGGGSSRCMVEGEVVNEPTENRAVDSVIALWLTDEARKDYLGETMDGSYYIYTVKSGDSWWAIAQEALGSGFLYPTLKEYNNWDDNRALQPGDQIKIPIEDSSSEDTGDSEEVDDSTDTEGSTDTEEPVEIPDESEDTGNSEEVDDTTDTEEPVETPDESTDTDEDTATDDSTQVEVPSTEVAVNWFYDREQKVLVARASDTNEVVFCMAHI